MTMQEYLRVKALSSSLCNTLLNYSPFHAKHEQDNGGDDPSEASETGTAIHDALLEGFDRIVPVDAPDWRKKEAQGLRDTARAAGKIPILLHKVPNIAAAVNAAQHCIEASELAGIFARGKPEQTLIWKEGNALLKARPDWLTDNHDVMLHVKTTTGSANPASWTRNHLTNDGYDLAVMFYERGLYAQAGNGKDAPLSAFLVIEQAPPHGCSIVALDSAMQELATAKVERAIRIWQECMKTGHFPCYAPEITYAEPLPWQMAAEEQRRMIEQYDENRRKTPDTTPYGEQA